MFEDLELLLKEAKRQHYQRKVKEQKAKLTLPKAPPLRQADQEWTVGKTVCLIHRSEDGTETALGLFIEHLRNGSRWLRPTHDTLSPNCTEIVTGSWWLLPSVREIPVDTNYEVAAIRSRFESLIQEFANEFNLPPILDEDDEEFPVAAEDEE